MLLGAIKPNDAKNLPCSLLRFQLFAILPFLVLTKKRGEKKEVIKNAYMNSALAATSFKAIRYIEMIDHEGVLYISSDVI